MSEERKAWDQQPGESELWFGRFDVYRAMGRKRTMRKARALLLAQGVPEVGVLDNWQRMSSQWNWVERAKAFDRYELELFRKEEMDMRQAARRERLELIGERLFEVNQALITADVGGMSKDEARGYLSDLRQMLDQLIKAERMEYGEASEVVDTNHDALVEDLNRMIEKAYGRKG